MNLLLGVSPLFLWINQRWTVTSLQWTSPRPTSQRMKWHFINAFLTSDFNQLGTFWTSFLIVSILARLLFREGSFVFWIEILIRRWRKMSAMCFCASVTRVKVKKIELAALACCYVRLPRLTPQNVHNAFSVAVLNVLRYGNTERVTCVRLRD